jgi:hypothetical protein
MTLEHWFFLSQTIAAFATVAAVSFVALGGTARLVGSCDSCSLAGTKASVSPPHLA